MADKKQSFLGIELGSTRIKAVVIDNAGKVLDSGAYDWENRLENGIWTYDLNDVWTGIKAACSRLDMTGVAAIGISAMMHGYLVFDKDDNQLVPFRTWRNTITAQAAEELKVPQRWSVAHWRQAQLNAEAHVSDIAFMTTLSGYVHWKLTGEKVVGIGDASGMAPLNMRAAPWDIMPRVLKAGEAAGRLNEFGAELLGVPAGTPLCPPEGDAGTGMVATNSVAVHTGNVSAGTSIFAMVVLENEPAEYHPEIDLVTTPDGAPVAMVHCNNCTGDLDAWVRLFGELTDMPRPELYDRLYEAALKGKTDGIVSYNYYSGEHVTGFFEGRPLLVRRPDSEFTFANLARSLVYSAMASLAIGMELLDEKPERLTGHGGLFKTPVVAQRLMASALEVPVSVMETAGEGGAWGMALLAAYSINGGDLSLEEYLNTRIFAEAGSVTESPSDACDFRQYLELYKKGLAVERAAVDSI